MPKLLRCSTRGIASTNENGPQVLNLKRWLDQVGSDNLRRIRKAAVTLASGSPTEPSREDLFKINRLFTVCLRKVITGCPELQDLVINECGSSNKLMLPISDHVLALTRVTGLERLSLRRWTSLYAADQMIRLLGLREKSEVKVDKTSTVAVGKVGLDIIIII